MVAKSIDKGLETPIERNAKFWCRRIMLEYLNLLYHKHTATSTDSTNLAYAILDWLGYSESSKLGCIWIQLYEHSKGDDNENDCNHRYQ